MMCGDCDKTLATSAGVEAAALGPSTPPDAGMVPETCAEVLETFVADGDCVVVKTGVVEEFKMVFGIADEVKMLPERCDDAAAADDDDEGDGDGDGRAEFETVRAEEAKT